jgi:peptide/nickel transport system permease protein
MTVAALPPKGESTRDVGGRRLLGSFVRRREGAIGSLILLMWLIVAIFPDQLVGPLQRAIDATGHSLEGPTAAHLLGTDEIGRDVLNLVVHGARISITVAILATVVTVVIGTVIGIVAGYFGGTVDMLLMRATDFFFVMPPFVLALAVTPVALKIVGSRGAILGFRASLFVMIAVIGLTSWAYLARVVRSQTLSLRERTFVDRAKVAGAGSLSIMRRHILPNVVPQIFAISTLTVAGAITTETALSFIGLGDPLQPSWGELLALAQQAGAASVGAWWYSASSGLCVLLLVVGFVLIGSALDESLNPRGRVIP